MKTHPAADIFPLIDGEAFEALVDDIAQNGLVHPIVTIGGKVLDGRNRMRACYAAMIEPEFVEYRGDDPFGYVLSANLSRRHLDASQRAMVAARAREAMAISTASEEKSPESANLRSGKSSTKVAKTMNVSPRSVEHAAKILEKGADATIKAVDAGDLAVSVAAKIADLPKMEQRTAIKEAIERPKEAADYSEEDQRAEYAADFEAMAKVIDADDKLSAAMGEARGARKHAATVTRLCDEKERALAQMTREAARWMKKAKKSAACQECMTALERP